MHVTVLFGESVVALPGVVSFGTARDVVARSKA